MSFYWNNTRPSGFTRWSCSTVQIVDFSMPLAPASLVVGPTFEVAVIIIFSILKLPVLFNFIQFSVHIFSGSVWPAVRFYPVYFWPEWTVGRVFTRTIFYPLWTVVRFYPLNRSSVLITDNRNQIILTLPVLFSFIRFSVHAFIRFGLTHVSFLPGLFLTRVNRG